jgi:hypothetical protein
LETIKIREIADFNFVSCHTILFFEEKYLTGKVSPQKIHIFLGHPVSDSPDNKDIGVGTSKFNLRILMRPRHIFYD